MSQISRPIQDITKARARSSLKIAAAALVLLALVAFAVYPPQATTATAQDNKSADSNRGGILWIWSLSVVCLNATFCNNQGAPGLSTHSITATYYSNHSASITEVFTGYTSAGWIAFRTVETDHVSSWKIASGTSDFVYVHGTNTTSLFMNGQQHTTVTKFDNFDSGVVAAPLTVGCQQFSGGPCPGDVSIMIVVMKVGPD
jgi:hypothetical protein